LRPAKETLSTTAQPAAQPHLIRALGRRDLVLLFVVAVFNLNVVPSIAANGGVTIWLWIISLVLFFWPQGIAVIELAHRYPGEGGVYLWAKEVFGDFHGFLSGWCYWTNNMLYVPTVMLYFVGVSVYVLGPSHLGLADNKLFASTTSLILLALLTILEYRRPRRRQVDQQSSAQSERLSPPPFLSALAFWCGRALARPSPPPISRFRPTRASF
jgi:hypothetical protein